MNGIDNLKMWNAQLIFRNFEGKPHGAQDLVDERAFAILLDKNTADNLDKAGWNVRYILPREKSGGEKTAFLQVTVDFNTVPRPSIVKIVDDEHISMTEYELDMLDHTPLHNVNLTVRPYDWIVKGKPGVKAYLDNITVTI